MKLPEEVTMLRKTMSDFARKEIAPIAEDMDRKDIWPEGMWKKLGEVGALGVAVSEEFGGVGLGVLEQVVVIEEIAKYSAAIAVSYTAHANLCAYNLYKNGSDEQRRKYLPALCSGDKIGALALTEPNFGSDAVNIQTSAKRTSDYYVLNGTKMFITNGPVANVMIVYAKTDRSKGAHGMTAFLVEKDFPGFSVSRGSGENGKSWIFNRRTNF